jgi:hypothetical protein
LQQWSNISVFRLFTVGSKLCVKERKPVIQFSEQIKINVNPEKIFALYEAVERWKHWDPDVTSSNISGSFTAGAVGKLKPAKGPEAKITIASVQKNKSFAVESKLPLCAMTFEHELLPLANATQVTAHHGKLGVREAL